MKTKMKMKKKTTLSTLMLGMAAMLASCGADDASLSGSAGTDGLMPMTITASLPDGGMTSRANAADDPTADNCYVQIRKADGSTLDGDEAILRKMTFDEEKGSFSLTLMLNPDEKYDLLFWADNTDNRYIDLKRVPYDEAGAGTTIAFAGLEEEQAWSASGIHATLKHVVTRVSVKSTTATAINKEDEMTLTVTVPVRYTMYDVQAMAPVEDSKESGFTYDDFQSATGATSSNPVQMGFFYTLQNNSEGGTQDLKLRYDGWLHNPEITITNVPMRPNYHVTLQGDVANAGLVEGSITAEIDPEWDPTGSTTVEFPEQDTEGTTTE